MVTRLPLKGSRWKVFSSNSFLPLRKAFSVAIIEFLNFAERDSTPTLLPRALAFGLRTSFSRELLS